MSYEESNERQRSRRGYRAPLDLGMGLFYIGIGSLVMVVKSFGDIKIPPVIAYVLGGMMVVGGCFRFYRGFKDITGRNR